MQYTGKLTLVINDVFYYKGIFSIRLVVQKNNVFQLRRDVNVNDNDT